MKKTTLHLGFDAEDMKLLKEVKAAMGRTLGHVSNVSAVRWALRVAKSTMAGKDCNIAGRG